MFNVTQLSMYNPKVTGNIVVSYILILKLSETHKHRNTHTHTHTLTNSMAFGTQKFNDIFTNTFQ